MMGILVAANFIILAFDAGFLFKSGSDTGFDRGEPEQQSFYDLNLKEEKPELFSDGSAGLEDDKVEPGGSSLPGASNGGSPGTPSTGEVDDLEHFLLSAREKIEEIKMSSKTRIEGLPSDQDFKNVIKIGTPDDEQVRAFLIRISAIYEAWGFEFPDSLYPTE